MKGKKAGCSALSWLVWGPPAAGQTAQTATALLFQYLATQQAVHSGDRRLHEGRGGLALAQLSPPS